MQKPSLRPAPLIATLEPQPTRTGGGRNQRRGTAAVEFAVIAPIMILFMFGTVEIGRLMMIKNAAVHASREGARVAVTPAATAEQVVQTTMDHMGAYASTGVSVTVTPGNLTYAAPGDMVTVQVTVDATAIRWLTSAVQLPISSLVSETTMRRESTN